MHKLGEIVRYNWWLLMFLKFVLEQEWSEFKLEADQSLIKSDQSLHSQDSSEFTRGKSSEADILQGRIEAEEWFADYGNQTENCSNLWLIEYIADL